jgi:hypothetical protein
MNFSVAAGSLLLKNFLARGSFPKRAGLALENLWTPIVATASGNRALRFFNTVKAGAKGKFEIGISKS